MKKKITAVLCAYLVLAAAMFAQSTTYIAGVPTSLVQVAPNVYQGGVQVALSNAQLIAAFTTPVQVAGLTSSTGFGPGSLITINSCTLDLIFATGAFSSGGTVTIGYGTTASTAAAATIASTVFTTFSANQAITVAGSLAVTATVASLINKPIYIGVGSGNFTNASSGTSTGILDCTYTVHFGLS